MKSCTYFPKNSKDYRSYDWMKVVHMIGRSWSWPLRMIKYYKLDFLTNNKLASFYLMVIPI